jgi:redox-sensitive bicupin YhaK (pirin superfamily)
MSSSSRTIKQIVEPVAVMEGAGVRLKRSIASFHLNYVDPFLLFDHFGSDNPEDYLAGFPMHPHRGIETVTYMLAGKVNHRDSLGNSGSIRAGDVQWMTAGRGIMHEEMPEPVAGKMEGFQLWINLAAKEKMTQPAYRDVAVEQIPQIDLAHGVKVRVIAGNVRGISGPVTGISIDPTYIDVYIPPGANFSHSTVPDHSAFVYVFEGQGNFAKDEGVDIAQPKLVVFNEGTRIDVQTKDQSVRFLLISGRPLHEPIARYGPFVMNTKEEIKKALEDLENGTFV